MLNGKAFFSMVAVGTIAGLAMLPAGNVRANMINNGDFSQNVSSYTTFPGYSSGSNPSAPTDWVLSVPANQGVNGAGTGFYAAQGAPFAPASMTGVTDFGFLQGAGKISQTVATIAGQAYTLTYYGAARSGETADVLNLTVTDATNSNLLISQSPAISDAAFNEFTVNFTASSASTTIQFANGAPATGPDAGETVDVSNITMAPVPEPATLGLLGAGVMGLLLTARKRAMV